MKENEVSNFNKTILMDDDTAIENSFRNPYMIIFIGKDSGKRHKIKPGITTIGRSPQADITIDDNRISRIHCEIKWSDGTITIEDKESRNGTYVDSHKVNHSILTPGVTFQLGHSAMKIEYKDEAELKYEQSLKYSASIDALTGIYNRQHFTSLALKEIAYSRRHQLSAGIIMIDIDNFKRVNDTYGHGVGDFVLTKIANVIKREKRAEDLFGRYGGDEFLIFPRGEVEKESIFSQCERIREAVERFEFSHADACVHLTISIGYHLDRPNGDVKSILHNLIDTADRALYFAKEKGKNRIESLI
ncbi:MAG: diguanylate cyclase [Desulfobulbia bacterium]